MPVTLKDHLESLTLQPDFEWSIPPGATSYKRKQVYVYFAQSEDGYVKIGCTQNLKSRIKHIQGDNHMKIKVIGKMKGSYDLETKLHRKFNQYRKRGEWFEGAPELLEYIATHKIYKGKPLG